MQFDEHEGAGGSQYSRDAAHPGVQVVDPAQDANRGVDEVEASVELAGQVTRIGPNGGDINAALPSQVVETREGRGREINASYARAKSRQRDRVTSNVTLQVQHVKVGNSSSLRRPIDRRLLFGPHERAARDEGIEVVHAVITRPVERSELLPMGVAGFFHVLKCRKSRLRVSKSHPRDDAKLSRGWLCQPPHTQVVGRAVEHQAHLVGRYCRRRLHRR